MKYLHEFMEQMVRGFGWGFGFIFGATAVFGLMRLDLASVTAAAIYILLVLLAALVGFFILRVIYEMGRQRRVKQAADQIQAAMAARRQNPSA